MNSFRPVSSSIEGVKFSRLSPEDIAQLSVKRISNPTTFDSLLNPIPGGLYDSALGAILGNSCSTCHLDEQACPGHCGHVELPVFVYHSTFMNQAFRLLKAQCMFCKRLKMSRSDVNRFCCKLKLISFTLLKEAKEIDDLDQIDPEAKDNNDTRTRNTTQLDGVDVEDIITRRLDYVRACIREHKKNKRDKALLPSDETILEAWKATTLEFNREIIKGRHCRNCNGISQGYRKNRFSSIFSKPLTDKDRARNAQSSLTAPQNSLLALNRLHEKKKRAEKQNKPRSQSELFDEGVADLDTTSNEDGTDSEKIDDATAEDQGEEEVENGSISSIDMQNSNHLSGLFSQKSVEKSKKPKAQGDSSAKETYLSCNEVHASLAALFELEPEIMSLIYPSAPLGEESQPPSADMFFVRRLLVPPNKFRKEVKTGFGLVVEPPDHNIYKSVLSACANVWQIQRELHGEAGTSETAWIRSYDDLQRACVELQECVNYLFDSSIGSTSAVRRPDGIRQKLEKKEGLFRMFIMGKRVNFAARTVISPDPNIEADEIGVPPVFARTLTYPEPVTSHSFEELKQAVKNGPNKWPGATAVEYENGQVISLRNKTDEDRLSIANLLLAPSSSNMTGARNKKVHRHLSNGDIVIMNRQPTLHKPSMMCHRAKVLPHEKTIRMHYANCKTYNADFDGDEMNMHFPQNELARAEAMQIADTNHQYLSATAGAPLRGLIQDHISMGVWLTCKGTFFTREEYHQLLYSCLRPENGHIRTDRIILLPPAFIKPIQAWTGKQVISTILENIRPASARPLQMGSGCSTPADSWGELPDDGRFLVKEGECVTGTLDKKQIGPSSGGLVHAVYEVYGSTVASKFLGILGRLLTRLLNMRAFSCGVEDLLLSSEGEASRAEQLKNSQSIGLSVASQYVSLETPGSQTIPKELLSRLEAVLRDASKQTGLDVLMNSATSALTTEVSRRCLPHGLVKSFPHNQMQTMTVSGAKGTMVNANQITCNLGQQVLEGKRVPVMVSGKTLPSFKALEPSVRAGGYISDRFLTGIKPQEFFFHAMAGREGLIDTAVKTAGSGYLQRCLVKGLEGARVEYDTTVRDSDGSIVQSLYGEDGLEIVKQQKLMDFEFLSKNHYSISALLHVHDSRGCTGNAEAISWNERAIKATKRKANIAAQDPALLHFPPGAFAGSVSEKFYLAAKNYIKENPHRTILSKTKDEGNGISRKSFEEMLRVNYLKAVVSPGEAVGVVAAQSIGEPSTQMTLNTFHLAGHAAKNVTLGVPRLREILMTASRLIKTPTMSLYPISEMSVDDCQSFAKSLSRLSLSEIIDSVNVNDRVGQGVASNARIYEITMNLYPAKEYTREHAISMADVVQKLELSFLPRLHRLIKAEIKRRKQHLQKSTAKVDALPDVGESYGRAREQQVESAESQNDGGDSEASEDGDDDAETAKRKANLDEGLTYEDPDEEEGEVIRLAEIEAESDVESESEDEGYGGSEGSSDDSEEDSKRGKSATDLGKEREARAKQAVAALTTFYFDDLGGEHCKMTFEFAAEDPKILLLDLVNRAARETLIQEVSGIRSCTVALDDAKKIPVVLTEGVNLEAVQNYQDMINPHRTYTNDIFAMSARYGVEAARNLIVKELGNVFGGHSIDVDHRHLTLVADYMTRGGGFLPFSRTGMKDKHSPFAKMSFETTMGFLRDAVLDGEADALISPSARITLGKVGHMGTGMCDVFLACTGK